MTTASTTTASTTMAGTMAPTRAVTEVAVRHLVNSYNPRGNRIGWLMMSSILVEAWDLYSIAFVLVFIKQQYNPNPLLLGLAAAAPQAGAVLGALMGGWLSDLIGRRVMFLSTMVLFVVFALAQAFVPGVGWLVVVRFVLGLPLGSDISNSYAYIMETLPKGVREVVGSRWQFMFALGEVLTIAVVVLLLLANLHSETIWRVTLGLGAVPALIILLLRHSLPETAIWLIRRGKFREAKRVSRQMYGDPLDMLPDEDVVIDRPRASEFLADTRRDPVRWRATLYGWIACFCQAVEFSTFAFYLPVLFLTLGVSSVLGNNLVLMGVYTFAAISGWIAPLLLPKIGHRGIGAAGFGIVFVSLLVAAAAIYTNHPVIVPLAAAGMVWGHYWDASNGMTVPTLVARPEYRGIASGFAYMFVKLPFFLGLTLFPTFFAAIGQAGATLFIAIFPLIGFLAAIFVLPEVYGYDRD